jgi:tRNA(Ile)-lysidine synthase
MPLLWCGENLVWVPGVGVAWDYRCLAGEAGVLPCWRD